jgi:hypothetical protein
VVVPGDPSTGIVASGSAIAKIGPCSGEVIVCEPVPSGQSHSGTPSPAPSGTGQDQSSKPCTLRSSLILTELDHAIKAALPGWTAAAISVNKMEAKYLGFAVWVKLIKGQSGAELSVSVYRWAGGDADKFCRSQVPTGVQGANCWSEPGKDAVLTVPLPGRLEVTDFRPDGTVIQVVSLEQPGVFTAGQLKDLARSKNLHY